MSKADEEMKLLKHEREMSRDEAIEWTIDRITESTNLLRSSRIDKQRKLLNQLLDFAEQSELIYSAKGLTMSTQKPEEKLSEHLGYRIVEMSDETVNGDCIVGTQREIELWNLCIELLKVNDERFNRIKSLLAERAEVLRLRESLLECEKERGGLRGLALNEAITELDKRFSPGQIFTKADAIRIIERLRNQEPPVSQLASTRQAVELWEMLCEQRIHAEFSRAGAYVRRNGTAGLKFLASLPELIEHLKQLKEGAKG